MTTKLAKAKRTILEVERVSGNSTLEYHRH